MVDKTEVFSSIFGTHTQGLSLFSNNAFRRPKLTSPEVGRVELNSPTTSPASKEGAPFRAPGAEKEEGKKNKKKKLDHVSSEPLSSHDGADWRDNPPVAVAGKKHDKVSAKKVKELHASQAAVAKRKVKQQVHSQGPVANHTESTNAESRVKHGKRAYHDVLEQQKPTKRQKTSSNDDSDAPIPTQDSKRAEGVSETKTSTKRKKDGSSPDTKSAKKLRKLEDNLEARYETKLRGGTDSILTTNEDPKPTSEVQEEVEEESKGKGTGAISGKRKRIEGDGHIVEEITPRSFDAEEKLKRTIFVGNLPLTVKKKALIKEFSIYGPVESVRLRSVPLLDTKIPRKGAIIKGQINDAVNSQNAYVVFKKTAYANAALAHNMKEFCGNHLRVDAAYAPHQTIKGKSSLQYDPKRSIFVGNIPFDVKDEELYQTFGTGKSPEMDIEAVRVVRDPQTSVSKGIAYVLFKTKAGALFFLSTKRKVKLRERILRINRVLAPQAKHRLNHVLASHAKHKRPSPSTHAKKVAELDNSQSERKRAKLSASYEGIRATKESAHLGQEKRKTAGNQQHIGRSLKKGSRGAASAIGTKRKRMEKHQRGTSRSKKIRRT